MIDFTKVKLYIFDLQQTLLNDFEAHLQAHKAIFQEVGVKNVQAALDEVIRLWGMRVFDVYKQILGDKFSEKAIQDLVEKRDDRYIEIFTKSKPVLCQGAQEILEYVKSKGLPVAVVSGIRHNLLKIGLQNSGFVPYADFMVGGDDTELGKPNPEPFLVAVHHFGLAPQDCLVIGDSFLDMEAAKNGGIPAVGVLTGFTEQDKLEESGASLVAQDLTKLLELMKQALA